MKVLWFECPKCGEQYTVRVMAKIVEGRLIPYCMNCNTNLVRRIK